MVERQGCAMLTMSANDVPQDANRRVSDLRKGPNDQRHMDPHMDRQRQRRFGIRRAMAGCAVAVLACAACGAEETTESNASTRLSETTETTVIVNETAPVAGAGGPSSDAPAEPTSDESSPTGGLSDGGTGDDDPASSGTDGDVDLPDGERVVVDHVIDGDTLKTTSGERVRLIGINTPEVDGPYRDSECGGSEASTFTKRILPPGTAVVLVDDVERYDDYDRRLAYVYRADNGLFVNAAIVREGWAEARSYRPNVAMQDILDDSEDYARQRDRGIWSECEG